MKTNKLELTWIGKEDNVQIESRILIEDKGNSYGNQDEENMLIHGDNLLALKALEDKFTNRIKCIYIDPPFNTGARINADGEEIGYDDGIEHSTWLNLMMKRLVILKKLLREDGAIFVHLDDNEVDYCKVLMDEIFGRNNFMNRITVDSRSPSAFSTVNPGVFKAAEYILFYAKNRNVLKEKPIRVERIPDYAYDKYLLNKEEDYENWKFCSVSEAFDKLIKDKTSMKPQEIVKKYNKFIIDNADKIFRYTAISDTGAGKQTVELKYKSKENPDKIYVQKRENFDDIYIVNGNQLSFYDKNVQVIDGKKCATKMLTDVWTDIAWEGIANEGNVKFKKGKKPEKLLKRCIELVSNEGDWVLDSFLGSGTTCAVAHKMNRKWIGIEMGEHCYTHAKIRMDNIINGKDDTGISKMVEWKKGGGYKFYELAPSLLIKDRFGNWIISQEYDAKMLIQAVCKLEKFDYNGNEECYWKHGKSSEKDYIFVTTNYVSLEYLDGIKDEMDENESLLICCKAFQSECENRYNNITIKKIPQKLLGICEFNKDNYNFDIVEEGEVYAE